MSKPSFASTSFDRGPSLSSVLSRFAPNRFHQCRNIVITQGSRDCRATTLNRQHGAALRLPIAPKVRAFDRVEAIAMMELRDGDATD
jgi:hypothetical protein